MKRGLLIAATLLGLRGQLPGTVAVSGSWSERSCEKQSLSVLGGSASPVAGRSTRRGPDQAVRPRFTGSARGCELIGGDRFLGFWNPLTHALGDTHCAGHVELKRLDCILIEECSQFTLCVLSILTILNLAAFAVQ